MNSHPFLTIFLPTLSFDATPELSMQDLLFYLDLSLSAHEHRTLFDLFSFNDLENVRAWILGHPMTAPGSMPHEELRERLEDEDAETKIFAVDSFLKTYTSSEDRVKNLHLLSKLFITTAMKSAHPFLRKYFTFENTTRIILSFLREQGPNTPKEIELQPLPFDLHNVAEWPELYQPLYSLWKKRDRSCETEKAIARWKFNALEKLGEESPSFSFDKILSYLIRLHLVETRLGMKDQSHVKNLELLVKVAQ